MNNGGSAQGETAKAPLLQLLLHHRRVEEGDPQPLPHQGFDQGKIADFGHAGKALDGMVVKMKPLL